MKPSICFIPLFFILLLTQIVQAQDETDIEALINANTGGIVQFPDEVYTIKNPFTIPSNTELRGSSNTVFEFAPNCGIGQNIPMIDLANKENVKITNIKFRGNQATQTYAVGAYNPNHPGSKKAYGNQFNTFIYAKNCNNITVSGCDFYDNLGDGLRVSNSKNIEFSYNTGSMGGHDVLFCLRSSGISVHNNNIKTLVNSAFRFLDVSHARIYNNIASWEGPRDAGPLIQIQHDSGSMSDIEIVGNKLYSAFGPAFWIVGKTSSSEDVWIHHNYIKDSGLNHGIFWVGGVIASGYNDILIENNCFDGSYLGAVNFYAVNSGWATAAQATLRNNLFINGKPGKYSGVGGYGIYNNINAQGVTSSGNCFWNNDVDIKGTVTSQGDYFQEPGSSFGVWTYLNGVWSCPEISPSEMGYIPSNEYDGMEEMTQEEISQYEFNDIFDILDLEFVDSALGINQGHIIPVGAEWQEKKKAAAFIYLAGYEGQVTINNHTFIPKAPSECAKVLTGTKNLASKPAGQTSELKLSEGPNNGLHAELKVKTKYQTKVQKSVTILGRKINYKDTVEKSKTETFKQDFPAPEVFPVVSEEDLNISVKFFNNTFNPHTSITIEPKEGTVDVFRAITYSYNGSKATDERYLGYVSKLDNGFKVVDYEETTEWKSNDEVITYRYQGCYIPGPLDPALLSIDIATPYNDFTITHFDVEIIEDPTIGLPRKILILFVVLGFLGMFAVSCIRMLIISFGRIR